MDKNPSDKSDRVLPIFLFGLLALMAIYAFIVTFRDKKAQQQNPPAVIQNR